VYVYVLRVLVCLVTARGLLYRSKPSIEATNVNTGTDEYNRAAGLGHGGDGGETKRGRGHRLRLHFRVNGGVLARYPSLRVKQHVTPLLQVPRPQSPRPIVATRHACASAGQMRSCVLSRMGDVVSAKGLQIGNYISLQPLGLERSSSGLLRSSAGLTRLGDLVDPARR